MAGRARGCRRRLRSSRLTPLRGPGYKASAGGRIAQGIEHWSPEPGAAGSNPAAPAILFTSLRSTDSIGVLPPPSPARPPSGEGCWGGEAIPRLGRHQTSSCGEAFLPPRARCDDAPPPPFPVGADNQPGRNFRQSEIQWESADHLGRIFPESETRPRLVLPPRSRSSASRRSGDAVDDLCFGSRSEFGVAFLIRV